MEDRCGPGLPGAFRRARRAVRRPPRLPYKFLTRHYPVRSQAHGEKKVFLGRKARFSPEERARGWHSQYDRIEKGHSFLRDAAGLRPFEQELFAREYLVERLSGVGAVRDGAV